MKFQYILSASLLTAAACAPSHKDSYTIKGEIEGLPDSAVVVLSEITDGDTETPLAEAIAIGGRFELQGATAEPRLAILQIKDSYGSHPVMIENGDIAIKGNVTAEEANDGKTLYHFNDMDVAGSPVHTLYLEKTLGRRQLDSAFMANRNEYADIMEVIMSPDRSAETYDSVTKTGRYQEMVKREQEIFAALDSNYNATVAANKETYWGPLLMYSMVTYLSPDRRDMYEQFSDSAKNSFYGKKVYNILYPVGRPGDTMPDFKASTQDGQEIDLMEFCKGKKAVLLDFWASWCRPCRQEIPNLKEIYNNYGDKGFDILSISIDAEEQPWLKAVKDEDLKWTNVRDTDHAIADLYKVQAVPTMYIIDGEGRLVAENLRGETLAAKVAELVK